MRTLISNTLAAAALFASANAYAEPPTWFEVELLVFTQADNSSEHWPPEQQPFATTGSLDLFKPVWNPDLSPLELALNGCDSQQWSLDPLGCQQREQQSQSNQAPSKLPSLAAATQLADPLDGKPYLLTKELLQFGEQASTLRRKGSTILVHSGWQMPVYGKRQAQALRVYGGNNFQSEYQRNGNVISNDNDIMSSFSWLDTLTQPEQTQPVWQLDGQLTIYLNHYLFIESRLGLREPSQRKVMVERPSPDSHEGGGAIEVFAIDQQPTLTEPSATEPFLATIALDQNRRVRSREIHYFDNPKLGMVIQIRRMEQPQPLAVDDTDSIDVDAKENVNAATLTEAAAGATGLH
ncbi:CsiV family protein [uncultured Ferrimonas sp.]|uniref:CsiV family protein n=1 Tax=uncultured Ferrimonas sp. TaxID=432640 RepID=UPI0026043AB0|nr:CsiV family protein [uncultured Ferrimonas sp.]